MTRLVFDIEGDGLLDKLTVIHSLCILDCDTKQRWSCTDHPFVHPDEDVTVLGIDDGLKLLMEADEIIGHNIIQFDIPAIKKVKPWFNVTRQQVTDTLVDARLIYPEIRNRDFEIRSSRRPKAEALGKVLYAEAKALYEKQLDEYEEHAAKIPRAGEYLGRSDDPEYISDMQEWREAKPDKPTEPDDEPEVWVKAAYNLRIFPGRLIGSQGLEAWGYRLGEWKGDYSAEMKAKGLDPWAEWNVDMQLYCDQDITVNFQLLKVLRKAKYSRKARTIERDFAWILAEMERNGFPFDMQKAIKLQHKLARRKAEIIEELAEAFTPIEESWTFIPKTNNAKLGYVKGEPVEKSKTIVFNPGSRDHIARWLKEKYGWKPKDYTDKGKPVIDEKILKKLKYPEAKLLAEAFLLDKRLGMLEGKQGNGLIPAARKHSDGRIRGRVMTNGAVTRRCTHSSPNMGQIPAVTVPYGREFRALLCALPGYSLLGWDASGLELRAFAHYLARYDGGAYVKTILEGDIHWVNAQALAGGALDGQEYDEHNEEHAKWRNKIAKRFIYAFLYGAGAETIGEIVAPTASATVKRREGKKLIDTFLKRVPAMARLKGAVLASMKKNGGTIPGVDGGHLAVRSQHSALNTLLQSAGAIAVKVATIMFYDKLVGQGLVNGSDFMLVAHVHDEVQVLVKKGLEDVVGKAAEEAMREAGEYLKFKCPLAAEYKYGANWADTH